MKKHHETPVPFIPAGRDFYHYPNLCDDFDPLGSYTGRTKDPEDTPVQDADDL